MGSTSEVKTSTDVAPVALYKALQARLVQSFLLPALILVLKVMLKVHPLRRDPPEKIMVYLVQQMMYNFEANGQHLFIGDTILEGYNHLGH